MNKLYDALELCLQEIENGAAIETALQNYPDLADELRPILEASLGAAKLSAPEPSADVVRRNRAKVLQRAAEMREANVKPAVRFNWFAPLRRLASTLTILVLAFASGTSLVGAAATSLPGENLYPVKRSWENLQVFFALNTEQRDALKVKHENERLEELRELFASGRSAEVTFNGLVTRQNETGWLVAGVRVITSPQTNLPAQPVQLNSAVQVKGLTQSDGSVLALSVHILPPGASLPEVEDDLAGEDDSPDEVVSTPAPEDDAPDVAVTQIPEQSFNGILDVLNDEFWIINGVPSDVSNAEIVGTPAVGAAVIVEGYFNADGVFIVTRIEFLEQAPDSSDDENDNDNDDNNNNQNGNQNGNQNSNDNGNGNDNSNSNDDDNDNDDDDDDGDD